MKAQSKQQAIKQEKAELLAKLKTLDSQVAKSKLKGDLTVQIGKTGCLSFYGMGKFPTNLYLSQLIRLREALNSPELAAFIEANKEDIAVKAKAE